MHTEPVNGAPESIKPMGENMSSIGYVNKQRGGCTGCIRTVSIRADVEIVPNADKMNDAQRDYRVPIQGIKLRAGWGGKLKQSGQICEPCPCRPRIWPAQTLSNLGCADHQDDDMLYVLIWILYA